MSALSKRIEAEIEAGRCTDVNTTDDNVRMLVTRYGFRQDRAGRFGASEGVWSLERYCPADAVARARNFDTLLTTDAMRMWERAESAIEHWQEQGAKDESHSDV